tara:strand:- start:1124 stop:1786 length:663 start_codon:yes stop_codon:yes gene_type:complete
MSHKIERDFKGMFIPKELYLNTTISWTQKIILLEVDSFSRNSLPCFISNSHLAKLIGISESGIEKAIKGLVDMDLLQRSVTKKVGGSHRTLKLTHTLVRVTPTVESETHPQLSEGDTRTLVRHTINKVTTNKVTKKRGEPSSLKECVEYFENLGSTLEEAEKFVDWYDSVGWKVKGGNKIKDWKACARQWKRRKFNSNGKKGFSSDNFSPEGLNDFVNNG